MSSVQVVILYVFLSDWASLETDIATVSGLACCSRFTKSKPTNVVTVVSIMPKAGIVLTLFEALKKDGNISTNAKCPNQRD
ncbi:hypothetical protein F5888DRAFT_1677079, partial [Russula emetica]